MKRYTLIALAFMIFGACTQFDDTKIWDKLNDHEERIKSLEALCDEIALINKSEVVLQGSVYQLRNDHKKDIYKFRLLTDSYDNESLNLQVLSNERYNEFSDVRVKKSAGMDHSQLIKLMLDKYKVVAFEEELPTMNEVFIETVTK